jgi:DivIVA domain-containing protein
MAANNPTLPGASRVVLTAKDVVRADFSQARRGYDPHEVGAHLGRVANRVAELEARVVELEGQVSKREAASAHDPAREEAYRSTAARIADLVRTFDEDMERLRVEAETESQNRLAEARAEAERIGAEARRSAEETLAALEARRASLLENVRRIRDGLGLTVDSVDAILGQVDRTVVLPDKRG